MLVFNMAGLPYKDWLLRRGWWGAKTEKNIQTDWSRLEDILKWYKTGAWKH